MAWEQGYVHTHIMHTPSTHHSHTMHTPCTCTHHAHTIHTPFTHHAHTMHTPCTCTHHSHTIHTPFTHHAHAHTHPSQTHTHHTNQYHIYVHMCTQMHTHNISPILLLLPQASRWTCLLAAMGIFIYQTLDAIDGKQARRTGTSSPLGEYFDHGCDAITTFLYAVVASCTPGLSERPYLMLVLVVVIVQLNYSYHWQTYVCGVLHFKQWVTTYLCCILSSSSSSSSPLLLLPPPLLPPPPPPLLLLSSTMRNYLTSLLWFTSQRSCTNWGYSIVAFCCGICASLFTPSSFSSVPPHFTLLSFPLPSLRHHSGLT